MDSPAILAQNLRRLQQELGVTCTQFSDLLGVSKSTLYRLETGVEAFSSSTLDQIAGALGTSPAELLGGFLDVKQLCESLLRTSQAFGKLQGHVQEKALYHLTQLAGCWT